MQGGRRYLFFTVRENVNVSGVTCRVPVQRRCSRNITFRVTVCSEEPENVHSNLRQ
jgi:hypothetical protein